MRTRKPRIATGVAALGIALLAFAGCTPAEHASQDGEHTVSEVEAEFGVGTTTFQDGTLVSPHLRIQITSASVILPGETGNEYGEAPVLAFWYETTNLTGQEVNPLTAWFTHFRVIQDQGTGAPSELTLGMVPDGSLAKNQSTVIAEGETVVNAVSYTLLDAETPVELIASDAVLNQIGSALYPIQ